MLLASTMAGMAMNPTRLGLAHALAMPLGSWDLKIPHSIAIAVTLPLVMEFNPSRRPNDSPPSLARSASPWMARPADAARRAAAAVSGSPTPSAFRRACQSSVCARITWPRWSRKR